MSRLFTIMKHTYRILPRPLRRTSPIHRLAFRAMEKIGDRDDIYSPRYYQTMVEPYAQRSAHPMAESIIETFHPESVVDVGCGSGALLVALRKLGVRHLLGLDSSESGLNIANARGLTTRRVDVTTGQKICAECFDVAVSMETAEHLPADASDRYVALLCSLAPVVIFTAAQPGQGGIGHINEKLRQYWIDQFLACGMHPADELVAAWQPVWTAAGVANFYTRNLMIFQAAPPLNPA
jgi:SAM-dependent methyltransferase